MTERSSVPAAVRLSGFLENGIRKSKGALPSAVLPASTLVTASAGTWRAGSWASGKGIAFLGTMMGRSRNGASVKGKYFCASAMGGRAQPSGSKALPMLRRAGRRLSPGACVQNPYPHELMAAAADLVE